MREISADCIVEVVADGSEALKYLNNGTGVRPHLILLDLNLPKISGHDVLKKIKSSGGLADIPVVVFSSSHQESDVTRAYNDHANCYVRKPLNLDEYFAAVNEIWSFWTKIAMLPYPHSAQASA